jgi:hypothetical protein
MAYRIIRASADYGLVIAVTPVDAVPESATAEYFRCADWEIGGQATNRFHSISREEALAYFSGHADGLGLGKIPRTDFATLDAVLAYRAKRMARWRFHLLVAQAHESSNAVDRFDLSAVDDASAAKFRELEEEARQDAIALIKHCQSYGHTLIDDLLGSMAERAKRRPANFAQLSFQEQWDIDRQLGILDWDGTEVCHLD